MGKFNHHTSWDAKQRRQEQINRDQVAAFAERQRRERETEKTVQQMLGTAMLQIPEGYTGVFVAYELPKDQKTFKGIT